MASTVLPNGIIIPEKYSRDWYADLYHNWQELDNLLAGGGANDGTLTIQKNGTTVGTFSANQATDETINIEVPDVNNGTLTIQKNGDTVGTFSANQSTNETINITVPDVNNATLTIQKNGTTVDTFTANSSTDKTVDITVPTKTSDLTNDSGFITSADLLPIGSYIQFAGSQAPAGFLVCNGGEISRTTYSALFAVIGTTYGSGDGSTTFNLPNLIGKFLQGDTTSGTVKNAGLPNITGSARIVEHGRTTFAIEWPQGCFIGQNPGFTEDNMAVTSGKQDVPNRQLGMNASLSNPIYGNSSTVQPPALTCLICIKY